MKKSFLGLKTFELVGLIVGILGFIFFISSPFAGLTLAGHLALAIFWLAAWFYISQPIPVYATSLLVMLLASLLLSAEGPIYKSAKQEFKPVAKDSTGSFIISKSALIDGKYVYKYDGKHWETIVVKPIIVSNTEIKITTDELQNGDQIGVNLTKLTAGYSPLSYKTIFGTLANPIIILFLGGFMLAQAAVKYRLDAALTAYLLKPFGNKPSFILFGLILVTAILSAFMSNTATTAMMMTVILPIIAVIPSKDKFKSAVVLSIPIAANIGGIATPIGTPPNAIVIAALAQQKMGIAFSDWVIMALPYTIAMLAIAWFLLRILYKPTIQTVNLNLKAKFNKEPKAIALYVIFFVTVMLWFTESLHGIPSGLTAFIPLTFLTFGKILDTNDIRSLSWEVLWLVSGGMALGMIIDKTGLAIWLLQSIEWSNFSIIFLFFTFAIVGWGLANFMSHTVTATLLMPLGISLGLSGSLGAGYSTVVTCMVIGIASSLAMILPISTPPNAIAMSTNMIKTKDMAVFGLIIGLIGIPLMIAFAWFYWNLFV